MVEAVRRRRVLYRPGILELKSKSTESETSNDMKREAYLRKFKVQGNVLDGAL